jgi:hypothetical protein
LFEQGLAQAIRLKRCIAVTSTKQRERESSELAISNSQSVCRELIVNLFQKIRNQKKPNSCQIKSGLKLIF